MKWEEVIRSKGIKRCGLVWNKRPPLYRDDLYDHRYVSEWLPGSRRIIMFFYKGKHKRYEVELHNFYHGESECYCDIGVWGSFNNAARYAAEWFALKRLMGEI